MKNTAGITGRYYEEAALQWLLRRGLRTVARNFRAKTGEIDIIALDGQCLVFVEVRSRSHSRFAGAAASVGSRKQARITRTAQIFIQRHPIWRNSRCRFDVIAYDPPQFGSEPEPTWIKGAFCSA